MMPKLNKKSNAKSSAAGVPSLSIFSGAGGLDLGLHLAGGRSLACIEFDTDCIATLKANRVFGKTALMERDIREVGAAELLAVTGSKKREVALLIGGPPCQPFSKAAYWTSTGEEARRRESLPGRIKRTAEPKSYKRRVFNPSIDPRSEMINEYLRILAGVQPSGFVFENVMSIRHPSSKPLFEAFLVAVKELGYAVTVSELNAAEFGVPQLRKRVFVTGLRGKISPAPPLPTHSLNNERSRNLWKAVSVESPLEAFAGKKYFEKEEVIAGRYAEHLKEIPPGWNYKALSSWAGHPEPSFEAETRFWHFLLKLHPEKPSWTIAASPGPWTGPFHWKTRRLRIPELAALQAFPKDYIFSGVRRSVQRQIGNAVPPLLAQRVIETVLGPIEGRNLSGNA
ncbi:MAG TPA: DNA cytosine methyltransferase [Terriglobales bacterium]|jgi:DNA (cytosine-5)-methyltransferase 1